MAPARIVIFDMYENDAYMLRNELLAEYDDIDLVIAVSYTHLSGRRRSRESRGGGRLSRAICYFSATMRPMT